MAPRLFRGWLEEGEDLQLILILSRCLFRFFEAGWLHWLSEVVQRSEQLNQRVSIRVARPEVRRACESLVPQS